MIGELDGRCVLNCGLGELFLGQSFGGLDSTKQPDFLADMESFFINSGIQGGYRWIHKFLEILPVPAIRHFLTARDRIIGVSE